MATELAVAYVSIVPSVRGISAEIHRELAGPTGAAAASAGSAAGRSFSNKFSSSLNDIVVPRELERQFTRVGTSATNTGESFKRVSTGARQAVRSARGLGNTLTGLQDTSQGVSQIMQGDLLGGLISLHSGFIDLAAGVAKTAQTIGRAAVSIVVSVARTVAANAAAVASVVAGWVLMGVQSLLAAAKIALAWLISLGPIALVIAVVAGVVALIIMYWDEIKAAIVAAATFVLNFLRNNWPIIITILLGPFGLAIALIVKNWDTIVSIFQAGIAFVLGIWQAGWDAVWGIVQAAWQTLSGFFTALPGAIAGFFSGAASWLVEGGRNIIRGLWNGILEIWAAVTGWFGGIAATIGGYFTDAASWLVQGGKNIITGLWDGIKAIWENVVQWFKDLPGAVLDALGIASPPRWAIDAGEWILRGIVKGLGLGVGNVVDFMSALADKFTGPLKDAWDSAFAFVAGDIDIGADISGFQDLGETLARSFGWTGGQFEALRQLWSHESGWNPSARNPTSGAYGIPQALPASKMGALAQASNTDLLSRAAAQITWGLGYISSRYGNPINALNMWNSRIPHWYDTGGVLPHTGIFGGHRGEVIFTPDQMRVLGAVMRTGSSDETATRPVVVEQHNYGITDYRELARRSADEVAWTMRVVG
jgi:hypothetical protein